MSLTEEQIKSLNERSGGLVLLLSDALEKGTEDQADEVEDALRDMLKDEDETVVSELVDTIKLASAPELVLAPLN